MKKIFIFIFISFYVFPAYSISSYSANYDLYVKTNLGVIKVGSAEYELLVTNNAYIFTNNASTDNLWGALYNYSLNETSIGLIVKNKLIGDYYKIIENQGDLGSDKYEINIYPNEGYVLLNNELMVNGLIKSNLENLLDSELILMAIDSGKSAKIKFAGDQSNDNNIPSYKKTLENRAELIDALLKRKANSTDIVDALSIYLNISRDIQKFPNTKVFSYQVVDKKGLVQRDFINNGFEKININNNEYDTIRVESPGLGLTLNISEDHNYMPVHISKTNGKTKFLLTLTNFKHL